MISQELALTGLNRYFNPNTKPIPNGYGPSGPQGSICVRFLLFNIL